MPRPCRRDGSRLACRHGGEHHVRARRALGPEAAADVLGGDDDPIPGQAEQAGEHGPHGTAGLPSAYRKARDRASYAFALASVAVVLRLEDGVVGHAGVAFGALAPRPRRARRAVPCPGSVPTCPASRRAPGPAVSRRGCGGSRGPCPGVPDGSSGPRIGGIQPVLGGRSGPHRGGGCERIRLVRARGRGTGSGRVRVRGRGTGSGRVRLGGRRSRSRPPPGGSRG